MDDVNAYISSLRKKLEGISHSECEEITAEIRSHIEGGLQDPRMGQSEEQRLEKTMSELGNPAEMADRMNKVHRPPWYMRLMMAGGAILLIISAFLPFTALARVVPLPTSSGVFCPFHLWWFGYPLIVIGAGMLFLSVLHISPRKKAFVYTIVGSLFSVGAAIAISLSLFKVKWMLPYAFLPMLIGGLILMFGGIWAIRKDKYSPVRNQV